MRPQVIKHRFVEFIPEEPELEPNTIYIAMEYNAVIHLCLSGCGKIVSTPLHPAQWQLTYNGEGISLSPSIGSADLECKSHYWIREDRVEWMSNMAALDTGSNRHVDQQALDDQYAKPDRPTIWYQRLWARLFHRS